MWRPIQAQRLIESVTMIGSASYLSCDYCDLSHAPDDTHCLSCGGNLDQDQHQNDSNDILLTMVTQLNTVLAKKTKGFLGARRELKMSVVGGMLCMLWMFGCLIIVNMQSFGSTVLGGGAVAALRVNVAQESLVSAPALQAANTINNSTLAIPQPLATAVSMVSPNR